MPGISYSIDQSVFSRFPGYMRGVLIVEKVKNGASSAELTALLRQAEGQTRRTLSLDHLAEDQRIAAWRAAYRAMGIKPAEHRPSNEAMLRRVLHGQELPSINALVDIGNIISLKYVMPVGSHAIDVMKQNITLGPASGDEIFIPFGSEILEHPDKGEIIFAEGKTALTRRWIWRQATHTLTLPQSTAVEINLDGLPSVGINEVKAAADEMQQLVKHFCGGEMQFEIIEEDNPSIVLRNE